MITFRPWGSFETLEMKDKCYQVKRIEVNPGQKLSLQYHNHRSEHWIVTEGQIIAQVGADFQILSKNQSIYIPKNVNHRIINKGSVKAVLIEVQIGDYLGEDDIVRIEDDYGRN
jgi:mannose-6-phosphate isomerase